MEMYSVLCTGCPHLPFALLFSTKNQYSHLFNGLCIKEQERKRERKEERGKQSTFQNQLLCYLRQGLGRWEITVPSYLVILLRDSQYYCN